jgi:hypothetical protein
MVAQASGLLFSASRRKPALRLACLDRAHSSVVPPNEIWRDARFDPRDAGATPFNPNSEVKKLWNQSHAVGARRSRRITIRMVLGVRELRIWRMLKRPEGRAPFVPTI